MVTTWYMYGKRSLLWNPRAWLLYGWIEPAILDCWNGSQYFLEQKIKNCPKLWSCHVSSSFKSFYPNPIHLMLVQRTQHSNMDPWLFGQNWKCFKFLLSESSQKRLGYIENTTKYKCRGLSWKPWSRVRIVIPNVANWMTAKLTCINWRLYKCTHSCSEELCIGTSKKDARNANGTQWILPGNLLRRVRGYILYLQLSAVYFPWDHLYSSSRSYWNKLTFKSTIFKFTK